MVGDAFLLANRVRNHSDGSIEVAITPQTGEHEAAIAALRPTQYGGSRDLAFAANNDACQVRVEQVIDETSHGKQVWTVKLRALERQSTFANEVNVQGIGADEIARRRVGRILLNDPPPRRLARSNAYDDSSFVDGFISGAMTGFEIKECVIRSVYHEHATTNAWKEFARLKSIYLMKMTGTIEHVLELNIGVVRGGNVTVFFRGTRPQRYGNVPPETIELTGKCPLG
jgi:acylphosphatase